MKRTSIIAVLAVAAVLGVARPACAQGIFMQLPPITNSQGQPIAGVTVSVFQASGPATALVCGTPVTVFSNAALSTPITSLVTDGFGNFPFYIASQSTPYGYTVSGQNTNSTVCYGFMAQASPGSSPTFASLTVSGNETVGGNETVTGTLGVTGALTSGALTASSVNGTPACPTNGATWDANVATGIASLPSSGGGILDCTNLTGAQSFAANITVSKPGVHIKVPHNLQLSGTGGFIVSQAAVEGFILEGPAGYSPVSAAGPLWTYTGTDCPLSIGSASALGTRPTIRNLGIQLGASAVCGIRLLRQQLVQINNVTLTGASCPNTQIGILNDGTGGFSADMDLSGLVITSVHVPVQMKGPVSGNNANQWYSGTWQACGKTDTGSTAADIQTGDSNGNTPPDLESADIGVHAGVNATHNWPPPIRMEGATINTHFKIDNGATFNKFQSVLQVGTAGGVVVSNSGGMSNSVELTGNQTFDGTGNSFLLNFADAGIRFALVPGLTADQVGCYYFYDHTQSPQGSICQDASKNIKIQTANQSNNGLNINFNGNTQLFSTQGQTVDLVSATGVYRLFNSAGSFASGLSVAPTATRTVTVPDATGTILLTGNGTTPIQTKRVTGCATGAAQFNTCDTTVSWTTAFADASYTVTCTGDVVTSGVPAVEGTNINTAKVAASSTVRTIALTAAAAQFTTIDCTAVHD